MEQKFKNERRLISGKDLIVDYAYQRPIETTRVRKIVRDFDPALVNTVKVSYRDGKYFVVDGQHTAAALKAIHGDDVAILCNVFYGMTEIDESELFMKQNGYAKPISAKTKFKNLLFENDKNAAAVVRRLEAVGMGVNTDNMNKRTNFDCVNELLKQYKVLGDEKFSEVLFIIRDSWWPDYCPDTVSKAIFAGVSTFVNTFYKRYNHAVLVGVLRKMTPSSLLMESRMYGYTNGKTVCAAIVSCYNKRRSEGNKLII